MGVKWTEDQQKVIELQDRNILVSAAAGSGKTAVLVERIIRMLTREIDPVDVDQLLVVTFTEAAAAEMKGRIREAIEKKLEERPQDERLAHQATLVHNAMITTIHSFALSVIRDHFAAIDLDPGFRIAEEGELKLLRQDTIGEMLEDRYREGDEQFLKFVSAYGDGRSDVKAEGTILTAHEFSRSFPDPEHWFSLCEEGYRMKDLDALEDSKYMKSIMNYIAKLLEDAENITEHAIEICMDPDGPILYHDALMADKKILYNIRQTGTYREMAEIFLNIKYERLSTKKQPDASEEKKEQVKNLRSTVKDILTTIRELYFYESPEEMLADMQASLPYVQVLTGLVREFELRYQKKKQEKEIIDFTDMEHYAFRILTDRTEQGFVPSDIAREYQEQFREIMIDEYQDINLLQESILTSVSTVSAGRYNVFMVGDVKQSIYRFRLSKPELFMHKYNTYKKEDAKEQRIDLHKNFRSRAEVLNGVNFIFEQIMAEDLGGICYDEEAALYPGASFEENREADTELILIDKEVEEAKVIAASIRRLMKEQRVTDKETGQLRPLKYKDIVILLRSMRGTAETIAKELNGQGIPAFMTTDQGYFAAQEIGVFFSYLKVLNNSHQDIPLAAALASCFGNLSQEELAEIKIAFQTYSFSDAVYAYLKEGENASIRRKLETFFEVLEELREKAVYTPTYKLIREVIRLTGYGDYVAALPAGQQRLANLEMLIVKARKFESSSYKGIYHFIRYIEQIQKYKLDYGEANLEDEQSDTVRIMSIHKSKGLEFPVVFVSGTGKKFNMQDLNAKFILSSRSGIGMEFVDAERRLKSTTLIKNMIKTEERQEMLGEELRILYVALTRAKEKLIITGQLEKAQEAENQYKEILMSQKKELSFQMRSGATTYLDYILPAVARRTEEVPICLRFVGAQDMEDTESGEILTEGVKEQIKKAELENWDPDVVISESIRENLEVQLGYVYPFARGKEVKQKYTVSELKSRLHPDSFDEEPKENNGTIETGAFLFREPEIIPLIPDFLKGSDREEEKKVSGAQRGTAYHRILELLDFSREWSEAELKEEMHSLTDRGLLADGMQEAVEAKDVMDFLVSPLGRRLSDSAGNGKLWREQPFVMGVMPKELLGKGKNGLERDESVPGQDSEERILVQGIIDAYFEEDGELVLVDYKSDRLSSEEAFTEKYEVQLEYYAMALEQMTKKRVKEKIIYPFTLGKPVYCGVRI